MVLNIAGYHFVFVDEPEALAADLRCRAEAGTLRGTILVAGEGVNLFLAGDESAIQGILAHLREDARFTDIVVKTSRSRAQPFSRLKVKVKPEIIAFRRDGASPLVGRAPSVMPAELERWIRQGHDDGGRRLVLLDTRNREEVGHGSFIDAISLPIDNFTELPAALAPLRATMADATVVSFCTGGIRCEKAALWLQSDGMPNVLQLEGGILNYFEQVGGFGYDGRCFVFDGRIALDAQLNPLVDDPSFALLTDVA